MDDIIQHFDYLIAKHETMAKDAQEKKDLFLKELSNAPNSQEIVDIALSYKPKSFT